MSAPLVDGRVVVPGRVPERGAVEALLRSR